MLIYAIVTLFVGLFGYEIGKMVTRENQDATTVELINKLALAGLEIDRLEGELKQSEDALVEMLRRRAEFELESA